MPLSSLYYHHSLALESVSGDLVIIGADVLRERFQKLAIEAFGDDASGEDIDGMLGGFEGKDGLGKGVLKEVVLVADTGVSDHHSILIVDAERREGLALHLLEQRLLGVQVVIDVLLAKESKSLYHYFLLKSLALPRLLAQQCL